jgi:DNA-binding beta-propeller fold protein YncE
MLALIYLGLAIALGDLLCRCFYRFVSIAHRWAAAILVGILLSTWFTYLAGLTLAHTDEPLLFADSLFFVIASGAVFWLSRKVPKISTIAARAPGSLTSDWITLAALSTAACILLIGTLYVNKQGRLCLSGTETSDFVAQLSFAQSVAVIHHFPAAFPDYGVRGIHQFLFYFQAGNLEFLGLNLAWSVDVLSVLGLTSTLVLVMVLGELLFHSRVVGRLGATFFFFHGFLEHLTDFSAAGYSYRNQSLGFWEQIAFVSGRHVPFATGTFLLVLIFLVDQYRPRLSATGTSCDLNLALEQSKQASSQNRRKTSSSSRIIRSAWPALISAKDFVFSGLLTAALPPWNAPVFIATAVVLSCLFVAYGCWRLWRLKTPTMLGPALGGSLTACILVSGVMDTLTVRSGFRMVKYEDEPLVKGLIFRRSAIYKIPDSVASRIAGEGSPKLPVTAFEGGHGSGRAQFDNARGIATDAAGNIFVADAGNGRVQKFSPNGAFVMSIQPFEAPSGIAIDHAGNIYVAEIGSKHRVQKLGPDGTFIAEWAPGLYGPRKIAIGPDDSIYVVDSGRNRIVKFSPDGRVLASWGGEGSGDGKFKGLTSVAVDPINDKVYVADPINSRIQLFDSNGKFLSKWSVPGWGRPYGFEDLAIDPKAGRLYASSAHMASLLIFDLNGSRLENLTPQPPDKLEEPSAIAVAEDKLFVVNTRSARVSVIPLSR